MNKPFRWNAANVEHIAEHGVTPEEAEYVIEHAVSPFPRAVGRGKFLVWGQTADGAYLQVVFVFSPPDMFYVIHARPLSESEKRSFRRRRR